MRVDVFTQVPHAFGWLTEQKPLATVLGTELELRLFNYRDTTPLRAGQVDDDPYGGGAGMVLRVDVVDAALEAAYGDDRPTRVVALTPQGRQLDQPLVEELAAEPAIAVLSSRFEGFDERIVSHLCTDAVSIGPYVLSGGELPAMVLLDAIARRLPGALSRRLRRARELLERARRRHRVPALHPAGGVPRLGRAPGAALRRPRADRVLAAGAEPGQERWVSGIDERDLPSGTGPEPEADGTPTAPTERPAGFWDTDEQSARPNGPGPAGRRPRPRSHSSTSRRSTRDGTGGRRPRLPPPRHRHSRNPVDRLTRGLPDPLRVIVDWVVTIVGAVAIVLLVKAYVVNPYRIPSSSMEPTLHCAQPASGCEARFSDRVLANRFIYHLRDPRRGEIVVFETPDAARVKCGAGGTFVKRIVGLPGETVEVRLQQGEGYVYINGRKLDEPYVKDGRRAVREFGPTKVAKNGYFMMGDNRASSCDSRDWGSVPRGNLIGKVFATYWPPNRISLR